METFLILAQSPAFWVGTVITGLAINIISGILMARVPSAWRWALGSYRKKSQAEDSLVEERTKLLTENPQLIPIYAARLIMHFVIIISMWISGGIALASSPDLHDGTSITEEHVTTRFIVIACTLLMLSVGVSIAMRRFLRNEKIFRNLITLAIKAQKTAQATPPSSP